MHHSSKTRQLRAALRLNKRLAALGVAVLLVSATHTEAQIGTPGNGPLYPGGPRQGLGPPSITDAVPDMRLRAPGNGIPGAGPPMSTIGREPPPAAQLAPVPVYRHNGK